MIQLKRAYEPATERDGYRVLVDRLWPRGLRRDDARLDAWLKDVAPSDALRRWFGHEPSRFAEFRDRYRRELRAEPARSALAELARRAASERVTLVYSAHDPANNNAVVLAQALKARGRGRAPRSPSTAGSRRRGRR